MLVDSDSTETSVNDASGIAPVDTPPTELDIRGIPTWWSGRPAASAHDRAQPARY
jgi:hypothetical protein